MTTQQQDIESLLVEVKQLREELTTITSKGGLVEKITFAGIPILFSCIVYLMMALNGLQRDNTILQSKIAIVVNADNKAIPPQGTTIEMEKIKEEAALARADMTLNRVRDFAAFKEEEAIAREKLREETMEKRAEIDKRLSVVEYRVNHLSK